MRVDQPNRPVERASLNGARSRGNAAAEGLQAVVNLGAFLGALVDRALFIGDARYVSKRKMREALIFFC
jgi:hypothetical protein